jgi:hypothetical protein
MMPTQKTRSSSSAKTSAVNAAAVKKSATAQPKAKPASAPTPAPASALAAKPSAVHTPAKPVSAKVKPAKKPSTPKIKLVRDSFTLPEPDHTLIKQCKKAAVSAGRETKKSEVLRAAIQVFSAMPVVAQLAAYERLSAIAVGRPKSK